MSSSPSSPVVVPLAWEDLLHVSPLVASIRMSIDHGCPFTVRRAKLELERARRRCLRQLASRDYRREDTVANLQADGLGRRLKGTGGTTMLYKLITQTPLRPDQAELMAEAA